MKILTPEGWGKVTTERVLKARELLNRAEYLLGDSEASEELRDEILTLLLELPTECDRDDEDAPIGFEDEDLAPAGERPAGACDAQCHAIGCESLRRHACHDRTCVARFGPRRSL